MDTVEIFIIRKSYKTYEDNSFFPKLSSGIDWCLCQADSGTWGLMLDTPAQ